MMYRLTYHLYGIDYAETGRESIVTETPFEYIEKVKQELLTNRPDMQVGSYVVEPINHLKVIK